MGRPGSGKEVRQDTGARGRADEHGRSDGRSRADERKRQHELWRRSLARQRHQPQRGSWEGAVRGKAGLGPNKAAGRKGGIRRQGSKRG
ncbi:MAG: hypothetical protein ACI360_04600 [Atopobiaceae bacterium]